MRIKIILLAICGAFVLNGCQSNAQSKNALSNNTGNIANKPINAADNSANVANDKADDEPKITEKQFDQIKLGMTKAEVERIIGAGKRGKSVADGVAAGETYRWSIGGERSVSVTFENGEATDISEETELDKINEKK